jgi:hypothetical protein
MNNALPCTIGPFNDWREEVRLWWNDWIENGWTPKKKQMLIISKATNTGKSFFVNQALFRHADSGNELSAEYVFQPVPHGCNPPSPFAFQHADPTIHKVIFCNEFDARFYNMDLLKNLLEGEMITPPIKHRVPKESISLQIPAIFISNYEIPDVIKGKDTFPLKERFQIVKIPEDAKIYNVDDGNEYKVLFNQFNETLTAGISATDNEKSQKRNEQQSNTENMQLAAKDKNNELLRKLSLDI